MIHTRQDRERSTDTTFRRRTTTKSQASMRVTAIDSSRELTRNKSNARRRSHTTRVKKVRRHQSLSNEANVTATSDRFRMEGDVHGASQSRFPSTGNTTLTTFPNQGQFRSVRWQSLSTSNDFFRVDLCARRWS